MDSSSASFDATTILNLNDVCLQEVFKHSELEDLGAIADVCSRFRTNAKLCFQYSKMMELNMWDVFEYEECPVSEDEFISRTSKVIRNFGGLLTKFNEDGYCATQFYGRMLPKCQGRIIELLTQHCSGTLLELELYGFYFDGIVPTFKPLLEGLQKICLRYIDPDPVFLEMVSLWSKELRVLELQSEEDSFTAFMLFT